MKFTQTLGTYGFTAFAAKQVSPRNTDSARSSRLLSTKKHFWPRCTIGHDPSFENGFATLGSRNLLSSFRKKLQNKIATSLPHVKIHIESEKTGLL